VKDCWSKHVKLEVIKNRGGFDAKLQDTLASIVKALNLVDRTKIK